MGMGVSGWVRVWVGEVEWGAGVRRRLERHLAEGEPGEERGGRVGGMGIRDVPPAIRNHQCSEPARLITVIVYPPAFCRVFVIVLPATDATATKPFTLRGP